MASKPIDITGMPNLPNIGYYNKTGGIGIAGNTGSYNSYSDLTSKLNTDCTNGGKGWKDVKGIFTDGYGITGPNLDVPYYLAKRGELNTKLNNLDTKTYPQNAKNQIQYLVCQLQKERNRVYDPKDFAKVSTTSNSVQGIFKQYNSLKIVLIVIFILSMYFFISGFFGSMDLATNIFSIIEDNTKSDYLYWIGLLVGLALPVIILSSVYTATVCNNLNNLSKYDITNDAYGVKNEIDNKKKNFDIITLLLFILLLYAFVAALFTIKRKNMNIYLYTGIVGTILFIIASFIYTLYAYVPFFNTANTKEIGNTKPRGVRMFIDQQNTPSNISTNNEDDKKTKRTFFISFVFIFILTILFISVKFIRNFMILNGISASSAILSVPCLWVLNFIICINYFYLYPIILILFRFIRYGFMSSLFIMSEKSDKMKDSFSDDLRNTLDNFKNYSPSWGLIGVDELKILLGIFGYNNEFSKDIIGDNFNNSNLSQNKFASTGYLSFAVNMISTGNSNIKGIIITSVIAILTIIISLIILFGIAKVNKL